MKNIASASAFLPILFAGLFSPSCGGNNTEGTSDAGTTDDSLLYEIPEDAGPEEQPNFVIPSPANIEEYFLLMPAQYVMADKIDDELTDDEKKAMILEKDLSNGYLKVEGKDGYEWPGSTEVVMWKKPNEGGDLIGVNVMWQYPEDPPHNTLTFWEYAEGNWTDVTASVYTPLTEDEMTEIYKKKLNDQYQNPMTGATHVSIKLPEKGTSIDVLMEDNTSGEMTKVAEYKFKGGRFVLTR